MVFTIFLNIISLCSDYNTQTHKNHKSCIIDLLVADPATKKENWRKWSTPSNGSAPETPIQSWSKDNNFPNIEHVKNKWLADSTSPHPVTHICASWEMIPRATRFALVGNLLRRRLQAKMDTLTGTCMCQIISDTASTTWLSSAVTIWYALWTE